jgi:hypothetical protein
MVDFKITKKQKLLEINNEMCHNYYYLICGRIFNEEKTKCRKFKYVEWFDAFEVQDFFEKDFITENDIKEYLNNLEVPYIYYIKDYNDDNGLDEFYDYCNETIDHYNNIIGK